MSAPCLFTPLALGRLTLANRIVIAPMCQYSAEDGNVGDWHLMHLGNLALSGAGLLIVEATGVTPEGRISPFCAGLWSDANEAAFARVLAAVRRHSPIALGIQLSHAGRKGSSSAPWTGIRQLSPAEGGWPPLAPSALAGRPDEAPPAALDAAGLARIRNAFVAAARRADRLGFDLVELHAAHGYLLHQFLSPLSNQRGDAYGGSLANRMRFPLEVFDAVRAVWPAGKPLGVRISATDWVEGGWSVDESIEFTRALQARGADFIHVSSGGLDSRQRIPAEPGYQLPFAARIKTETGLPTIAVGLITDPHQAERVVAEGHADLVALARGILYDPRWPWHAAQALGARVSAPPQYWRCAPAEAPHLFDTGRPG